MSMTLAEHQGLGSVRVCKCGSLNLNIGPVTLHLDPETFLKAAALLRQAAARYVEQDKSSTAASMLSEGCGFATGRFTN